MRILLANKFFFRNGGSEVVMFQERDFLLGSGHEVVDFSMQDARNFESPYASYFVQAQDYRNSRSGKIGTALSFIHSAEAARNISRLIADTQPDIVHCHNIYHQLTPSIIGAAEANGVPVVLTLHDSKPVCPSYTRLSNGKPCSACLEGDFSNVLKQRCADGSLGKSALLYAEAVIQRWMGNYEQVAKFIAPSRFMRSSVLHRFRDDQVDLLYNGVDTKALHSSEIDRGYVLFLGRLSQEKGVETLLKAHAASSNRWPLRIAGTGPLTEDLKNRYPGADFLGHLSGDALHRTIAEASIIVLPSECFENCPMSILEAMTYGKPVVGSRMGGIPELVVDGVTGKLFSAGNHDELRAALDGLMADPALRYDMGKNSRERAELEFDLEHHNRRLMQIYASVLGSR